MARKPNSHQMEQSKRARIERQAAAWYASPAGQRHVRVCEAFSALWRRQLAELEAQRGLRHERP